MDISDASLLFCNAWSTLQVAKVEKCFGTANHKCTVRTVNKVQQNGVFERMVLGETKPLKAADLCKAGSERRKPSVERGITAFDDCGAL